MEIDIQKLGVRVKGTDTIWPINTIDFTAKIVTYYSFGRIVPFSFNEVDILLCD